MKVSFELPINAQATALVQLETDACWCASVTTKFVRHDQSTFNFFGLNRNARFIGHCRTFPLPRQTLCLMGRMKLTSPGKFHLQYERRQFVMVIHKTSPAMRHTARVPVTNKSPSNIVVQGLNKRDQVPGYTPQ